jgi:hypothetical protein
MFISIEFISERHTAVSAVLPLQAVEMAFLMKSPSSPASATGWTIKVRLECREGLLWAKEGII